jgi:hypothetical protein
MMKLYASAASSFARKIRVILLEKGIEHELVLVNLWEPNKLHEVNPLGKVPASNSKMAECSLARRSSPTSLITDIQALA